MNYQDRIEVNPEVMLGKPVIKGTRITVELILKKLSEKMSPKEIIKAHPSLSHVDILAALSYSADVISKEEMLAT